MTQAYFTVPKILDTDPTYKTLSVHARYLYARMRDTMQLSIKNGWRDEHGVYIKMKRVTMAALLNRSVPTVRRIIRELIDAGLLRERRIGLTQANRLYVQYLPGETEIDPTPRQKKALPSRKKPDFTPDRKPLSPNNPKTSEPDTRDHFMRPRKDWQWFITEGTKWFDNKTGKYWQMLEGEIHPLLFGDALREHTSDLLRQLGMGEEEARALSY